MRAFRSVKGRIVGFLMLYVVCGSIRLAEAENHWRPSDACARGLVVAFATAPSDQACCCDPSCDTCTFECDDAHSDSTCCCPPEEERPCDMFDPPCSVEAKIPCRPDEDHECSSVYACDACCNDYILSPEVCESCLIDECEHPCANVDCGGGHGECVVKDNRVICECKDGFEGPLCADVVRSNVCAVDAASGCTTCSECCKSYLALSEDDCDRCVSSKCSTNEEPESAPTNPAPTPSEEQPPIDDDDEEEEEGSGSTSTLVCDPVAGCNVCDACCKDSMIRPAVCEECVASACGDAHPCESVRCGAHGVCAEDGECECDIGWTGSFCEKEGSNDGSSDATEDDGEHSVDESTNNRSAPSSSSSSFGASHFVFFIGTLFVGGTTVYLCFVKNTTRGGRFPGRRRRAPEYERVGQRDVGVEIGTWDEINKLGPSGVTRGFG